MPPIPRPWRDRFFEKVDQRGDDECWPWTAGGNGKGYGTFWLHPANRYQKGERDYAHRIMYRIHKGEIPKSLEIDHLCRNRWCVNPAHLEAVTRRENQHRGNSFGGVNSRKTHCPNGHPYDDENTYEYPMTGYRACRACTRERMASYLPAWRQKNADHHREYMREYKRAWRARRRAAGLPPS